MTLPSLFLITLPVRSVFREQHVTQHPLEKIPQPFCHENVVKSTT